MGWPAPLDVDARAEHWRRLWHAFGRSVPSGQREELEQSWAESQRHYHDARHLGECLAFSTRWWDEAERPAEVAIALWFHDAVYEPTASDNESISAAWAARTLLEAGLSGDVAQRVYDLVMATRHDAPAESKDARLLVDIDLTILGSPPERFEAYDIDVRREYSRVPGSLYRRKRIEVLHSFVDRSQLYHCAPAVELLETRARLNLAAAISRLAQSA